MTPATKDQLPKEVRERIERSFSAYYETIDFKEQLDFSKDINRAYTAGATHEALRAEKYRTALIDAKHSLQFPDEAGWIAATIDLIEQALAEAGGAPTIDTYEHP